MSAPSPAIAPVVAVEAPRPVPVARPAGVAIVARERLASQHLLVPGAPVGVLAEEFRLIERQVLLPARAVKGGAGAVRSRMVLVCSAHPDEGQNFRATTPGISIAPEKK